MAGQMLLRASPLVAGPPGCWSSGSTSPMADMSSTGTTTWRSSGLRAPASTIVTSRPGPVPARKRPIASSGRWVADRPIRCSGGASAARRRSRRSRLSARWAPRLVPAIAWTSSTMTCSTPRRTSRTWLVSIRYRDSGVVMRMSGGWRAISRRSSDGVSPVRLATVMVRRRLAEALGRVADPGERRPQVPLDVVGQGLERRDVEDADGAGRAALGPRRRRMGREAVQRPEERGERLAAPRRGVDQRVPAGGDRRPAAGLRVGGRLEARLEPLADGARERGEGVGGTGVRLGPRLGRGHGTASIGRRRVLEQMVEIGFPDPRSPLLAVSQ